MFSCRSTGRDSREAAQPLVRSVATQTASTLECRGHRLEERTDTWAKSMYRSAPLTGIISEYQNILFYSDIVTELTDQIIYIII